MSKRYQLNAKLEVYRDMRTMMGAMKNIALMELHKLGDRLNRQRTVMATVEQVAVDFAAHYDLPLDVGQPVCIVLGAERGLCGDFNHALLPGVAAAQARGETLLLVGHHLIDLVAESQPENQLPGPNVMEEIPAVLSGIAQWLEQQQAAAPGQVLRVSVLSHGPEGPAEQVIAPLPHSAAAPTPSATAPVLFLPPEVFLRQLMTQAMLLALEEVFTTSLAAENRQRLKQMESALKRLDEMTTQLQHAMNRVRQAEIVQEIETMLTAGPVFSGAGQL